MSRAARMDPDDEAMQTPEGQRERMGRDELDALVKDQIPSGFAVAVDANCPGCGKAERAYDPERGVFMCSSLGGGRCGYESEERNR